MAQKPHIIIFNPDQWRGDVMGHMGNPGAVTPHLDAIIENDAVSFRHAYCQNPLCTPSRCSFMTGWYPHVRGHRTLFHMLQEDEPMLLRRLKEEGYFVWWGGKNDVIPGQDGYEDYCDVKYQPEPTPDKPLEFAFQKDDTWRGSPEDDTFFSFYYGKMEGENGSPYPYDRDWALVDGAIEQIKNAPDDQPLCIYLPILFPHPVYAVEDPWYSMIDRDLVPPRIPTPQDWSLKPSMLHGLYERLQMKTWDEARWQELRATYYGMCARVDHQFGLLVDALKKRGIYDDTAIFFFSDHGDFTGDYGVVEKAQNLFYECLTRVPFVVKPPANIDIQPGICDALVELVDFSATVEDLLNIEPNHTHFGQSLLPLIKDHTAGHRDAVFCEGGRVYGEVHAMEREAPIHPHFLYMPKISLQLEEGPTHTKAVMCRTERYKYIRRLYEVDELYDLELDPGETRNLIHEPDYAAIRLELIERVLTFFLETGDVVPFKIDERN